MDLLKVKLKNYLSYKNETFDLRERNGLTLITGTNGSGKSAVISSVPFALFGRCRGVFDKELNNEDYIHKDQDGVIAKKCTVEVDFEHGGKEFKVIRTISQKGSATLKLFCGDAELTSSAGLNKRTGKRESGIVRTEGKIADLIGCDVDLFINSAYFEQQNIGTFARGTLSEKDTIIRNTIGIDRWVDYSNMMSEDLKVVEKELARIKVLLDECGGEYDVEDDIEVIKVSITNIDGEISNCKSQVSDSLKTVEKYQKELTIAEHNIKERRSLLDKQATLERRIEGYKWDIQDNELKEKNLTKNLLEDRYKLEELKKLSKTQNTRLDKLNGCRDREEVELSMNNARSSLDDAKAELVKLDHQISENIKRGKEIKVMTCPLGLECDQLSDDAKANYRDKLLIDYKSLSDKKNECSKVRDDREKLVQSISGEMDSLHELVLLTKDIERCESDIKSCEDLIESNERQQKVTTESLIIIRASLNESKKELEDVNKIIDSSNDSGVYDLKEQVKYAKSIHRDMELNLSGLKDSKYGMVSKLDRLKKMLIKQEDLKISFNKTEKRKQTIKLGLQISKKDIPHQLISNTIPEILNYSKQFIYKLSSGKLDIDFKMDKKLKSTGNAANAFDIFICVEDKWLKYALASGGQRARVDVALHLAYICFITSMNQSKIDSIFLDEVGSELDREGVENFIDLIKELIINFGFKKVLAITQNIEYKKLIEKQILVTLTNNGSVITDL